jgi:hypothetical protein
MKFSQDTYIFWKCLFFEFFYINIELLMFSYIFLRRFENFDNFSLATILLIDNLVDANYVPDTGL